MTSPVRLSRQTLLRKHLALPQQHGAWVMWGGPLVVGAVIGGAWTPALLWLGLASLGAFLALQPLTVFVKVVARRRPEDDRLPALFWLAAYGALTAVGGLGLIVSGANWVLAFALLAVPVLIWQMVLVARRAERGQMGVELVGAGVLALNAPAAHSVSIGGLSLVSLMLGSLCWLQAAGAIVYIYLCLDYRRMKSAPELAERWTLARRSTLYHVANVVIAIVLALLNLVSVWTWLPFALMFAEALYGGVLRPPVGVRPVIIGVRQLIVSTIFYLLLIAVYRV